MKRRDFLKLSVCASALMSINSCYLPKNPGFPFVSKNKGYKKRYFKYLDEYVEYNKKYFEEYFPSMRRYLRDYSNSSRKYRINHEKELIHFIKPLQMAIEYVVRENLCNSNIYLLHNKSAKLFNRFLERVLRKNAGGSFLDLIILKSNRLSLGLIIHEYGHFLDNKINVLNYLRSEKEKIRTEMVAEYNEVYVGYNIAKLWNKEIGKDLVDEPLAISDSLLDNNHKIDEFVKEECVYDCARIFNMVLLNDFGMDLKKTWEYLVNNNKKNVFNKLKEIEKKGSFKDSFNLGKSQLQEMLDKI